jgi:hypothetical protein
MFVCYECCVLSGRNLCDELITRPEEFYLVWCVTECDSKASIMRTYWLTGSCCTVVNIYYISPVISKLILNEKFS